MAKYTDLIKMNVMLGTYFFMKFFLDEAILLICFWDNFYILIPT